MKIESKQIYCTSRDTQTYAALQEYYNRYSQSSSANGSDGANEAQYVDFAKNRDWEYLPAGACTEDPKESGVPVMRTANQITGSAQIPYNTPSFKYSESEGAFKGATKLFSDSEDAYHQSTDPDAWEYHRHILWQDEQSSALNEQQPVSQAQEVNTPAHSGSSQAEGHSTSYSDAASGGERHHSASGAEYARLAILEQEDEDFSKHFTYVQLDPCINAQQQPESATLASSLQLLQPPQAAPTAATDVQEECADNDLESLMALCCS